MQYLESMSKDVKVIVVGTPTAGIANQETAAVSLSVSRSAANGFSSL